MRYGRGAAALLLLLLALPTAADEAARTVELSSLDWPPYIGDSLPAQGFIHQIAEQALARQGYRLKVRFLPWARAVEVAREGKSAGVFPEYYEAGRKEEFAFSDPMPGGPMGFYKRRAADIRFVADPRNDPGTVLQALKGYRFGVVRGYINNLAFDVADFLVKEEANSDELNLKKLAFSRVDLIVIDELVARHILATRLPELADQLEFMRPPLEHKPLYIAFSRQDPQWQAYRDAFNAGLKAMREDGALGRIMERAGVDMQVLGKRDEN